MGYALVQNSISYVRSAGFTWHRCTRANDIRAFHFSSIARKLCPRSIAQALSRGAARELREVEWPANWPTSWMCYRSLAPFNFLWHCRNIRENWWENLTRIRNFDDQDFLSTVTLLCQVWIRSLGLGLIVRLFITFPSSFCSSTFWTYTPIEIVTNLLSVYLKR